MGKTIGKPLKKFEPEPPEEEDDDSDLEIWVSFASAALPSCIGNQNPPSVAAKRAAEYADAMMQEFLQRADSEEGDDESDVELSDEDYEQGL